MITIHNCNIENCGTAISAPADTHLDIAGTQIIDCDQGVEIRSPEALLGKLGFRPDTPPGDVAALIQGLRELPNANELQVSELIEQSGLSRFVSGAANVTTISAGLYQLSQSQLAEQIIAILMSAC